jgi:phenylacetic acid degradation operon negative regulatory protein
VDRAEEVQQLVRDLDLVEYTVGFIGKTSTIGLHDHEIVRRAWSLGDAAERYEELITKFEKLDPKPGDEVLFAYLALAHEWQDFPRMDPQLPHELLPDWIGWRARKLSIELRTLWAPSAHQRWREIINMTTTEQ